MTILGAGRRCATPTLERRDLLAWPHDRSRPRAVRVETCSMRVVLVGEKIAWDLRTPPLSRGEAEPRRRAVGCLDVEPDGTSTLACAGAVRDRADLCARSSEH
jgi:hypothetical protein